MICINRIRSSEVYTWLEAHGESEVDNLERGALRCIGVQEILRLKVPVHNTVLVAMLQKVLCFSPSIECVHIVLIIGFLLEITDSTFYMA